MSCRTTGFRRASEMGMAMSGLKRASTGAALLVALSFAAMPGAATGQRLTLPPIPADATPLGMDGRMEQNGVPLNLQAFVSPASPEVMTSRLVQSAGVPMVRSRRGPTTTLAAVSRDEALTIVIDPAGTGSRVLMSVTAANDMRQSAARPSPPAWMNAMPYDARVMTDVDSVLPDERSRTTLVSSTAPIDVMADRLIEGMREDGLARLSDTTVDTEKLAPRVGGNLERNARAMVFEGRGVRTQATVHADAGRSYVVVVSLRPRESGAQLTDRAPGRGLISMDAERLPR